MLNPVITLDFARFERRASRLRAEHRALRGEYDRYDDLYHKRHWMEPPADEADYQVVLPIHTITVNTAHGILTGMKPQPHVYPNNAASPADVKRADDVEQWHLAVDMTAAAESGEDQWEAACFNQAKFGVGVLREVYDFPAGWISGEIERLDHYPIVQHSLDPRQVYFEFGAPPRGLFSTVFYECEMTVGDILYYYPDVELLLRYDADGRIVPQDFDEYRTVVDWWEWIGGTIYHTVFAEIVSPTMYEREQGNLGQFLKDPTPMPEYYALPYHIFAFHRTTAREPHKWGLSVLYPLTDLPHYLEILASRQMRREEMYSDPTILAQKGPNSPGAQIEIEKGPGKIIDLEAGDNVSYLTWQGSGPDTERLWQKIDDLIHELSFLSRALAGGTAQDVTGFKTALDRESSILKISKAIQNYEAIRASVYKARAWALSKLSPNTSIPARGITPDGERYERALDGKRLARYMDITVEVKPSFPGDKQREVAVAQQAIAAKLWPLDQAMDYVGLPNGGSKDAARTAIVQDQLEYHPEVLGAKARQIAALIDLQTQELTQSAQGSIRGAVMGPSPSVPGLPGTGGTPGIPAGPAGQTPQGAGVDNRLRPAQGTPQGLPVGTVTPQNISDLVRRAGRRPQ